MSNPKTGPITARADKVAFEYTYADGFRSHHVDGATGGVTPNGFIHFAVYSEKFELPKKQLFGLNSDGTLGSLLDGEVGTTKIVRELSADIFVTLAAARGLRDWLGERITELESLAGGTAPPQRG
jgi:hypothetical protein